MMVDPLTRGGCQGTTTATILRGGGAVELDGWVEVRWPAPQNHPTSGPTFPRLCQPHPNGGSTADDSFPDGLLIRAFRRWSAPKNHPG